MAKHFEGMNSSVELTITLPFTVKAGENDSVVYVYGKATGDDLDSDEQIIDKDFVRRALKDWFAEWANIRQMHNPALGPAGKGVELEELPDGFYLKSKIMDENSVRMVREKVYQAYSIGISKPRIIRDARARNGRIVDGIVVEVSLVDYPANPTCKLELVKRRGLDPTGEPEWVGKNMVLVEEAQTGNSTWEESQVNKDITLTSPLASGLVPYDLVGSKDGDDDNESDDPQPDGGNRDNIDMGDGGSGGDMDEEEKVEKKDVDPNVGGGVDRDKIPAEDFAGPDRSFPIVTPGDVSDAASSLGRAKTDEEGRAHIKSRIISIAYRKGDSFVKELPEDWKKKEDQNDKSEKTAGTDMTTTTDMLVSDARKGEKKKMSRYALKRWHDVVCSAYSPDAIKDIYPSVMKDGMAMVIGPEALMAMYTLLMQEVLEDGGTGKEAYDIKTVADGYNDLAQFLANERWEMMNDMAQDGLFYDIRAEMYKSFRLSNPDIGSTSGGDGYPIPMPSMDTVEPGRFRRPVLSAGHAAVVAGSAPPVPTSGGSPISASEFTRGPLTEGHERPTLNQSTKPAADLAPLTEITPAMRDDSNARANRGSQKGRTYYSNNARDNIRGAMQAVHDALAEMFPDLCTMESMAKAAERDVQYIVMETKTVKFGGDMDDMKDEKKDVKEKVEDSAEKDADMDIENVKKAEDLDVDDVEKVKSQEDDMDDEKEEDKKADGEADVEKAKVPTMGLEVDEPVIEHVNISDALNSGKAPGEKAVVSEPTTDVNMLFKFVENAVKTATTEIVTQYEERLVKMQQDHAAEVREWTEKAEASTTRVDELEKIVEKLSQEPDPAAAAYRGSQGAASLATIGKSATVHDDDDVDDDIRRLTAIYKSSNASASMRDWAERKLREVHHVEPD